MAKEELTLTLKVKYETNGEAIETLKENLSYMVDHAIGWGLLTGDTDAEVDKWEMKIE